MKILVTVAGVDELIVELDDLTGFLATIYDLDTVRSFTDDLRDGRPVWDGGGAAPIVQYTPLTDLCLDCDGAGTYPNGATCECCYGTGAVGAGESIPITIEIEDA